MSKWVEQGVDEYAKRLPREIKLVWREIPLAQRKGDASVAQLCEREGEKILKAIPSDDFVIALDVVGKRLSTENFAQALGDWQMSGQNYSILIGGPDGLSPGCLDRANKKWSLSDLTLPHPLVRVLFIEQLYRAWTITANHPYHRQ